MFTCNICLLDNLMKVLACRRIRRTGLRHRSWSVAKLDEPGFMHLERTAVLPHAEAGMGRYGADGKGVSDLALAKTRRIGWGLILRGIYLQLRPSRRKTRSR